MLGITPEVPERRRVGARSGGGGNRRLAPGDSSGRRRRGGVDRQGRVAGRDHRRDHHQRGSERGQRFREMGLRHHPASRPNEAGLRDCRRRARRCRDRVQEPRASLPGRYRLRHVADRLRRRMPLDALHRQANEGALADAGDRPGEPGLAGQGFRLDRRLQRHAEQPARGACAIRAGRRRCGRRGDRRTHRRARAGVDRRHRGDGGAPSRPRLRPRAADRLDRLHAHQGAEGRRRGCLYQRRDQATLRGAGPTGVRTLQGAVDGAVGICLRRAARQHRGNLQEAFGAARYRGRDTPPEGAAPHCERGHPRAGAGRRPS